MKLLSLSVLALMLGVAATSFDTNTSARESAVTKAGGECSDCSLVESLAVFDGETAIKVPAGTNYRLKTENVSGGGIWSATFGTIDSSGNYYAPAYMPPFGTDEIKYVAGGVESRLVVVIEPNSSLPNSDGVRYIKLPRSWKSSNFDASAVGQVVEGSPETIVDIGPLGDLAEAYPNLPIVGPGDDFPDPVQVWDCHTLVFDETTPANEVAARAPSLGEGDQYDDIMLVLKPNPGQPSPKKCKVKPRLEDISGDDYDNGEDVFKSRVYMYGPTYLPSTTGQMPVTVQMAADIKNYFGITLEGGVQYPLARAMLKYTEKVIRERYSCVNGKLKFIETQRLCRTNWGEITSPTWAAYVDGYPQKGQPLSWDGIPYVNCN